MGAPQDLLDAALAARERAYAPYSRFLVGAAIRTHSGAIVAGCNVENAAYPQGACAEAGAISAMLMAGERRIAEVCVVGDLDGAPGDGSMGDGSTGDGSGPLCTPCGGCRQRLREFAGPDTPVHVGGLDGWRRSFTLAELLPASFGPDNLA